MKRSKALEFIANKMNDSCYYDDFGNSCISENSILEWIEQLGMLPPEGLIPILFEEDGKQYPLVPGDFKNNKNIWCTPKNQWESEEE